jgi:hypothetical protein
MRNQTMGHFTINARLLREEAKGICVILVAPGFDITSFDSIKNVRFSVLHTSRIILKIFVLLITRCKYRYFFHRPHAVLF